MRKPLSLTPVIELGYYNQGVDAPPLQEKHSGTPQWSAYRTECMRLAGMPSPVPPAYSGTDFYDLETFTEHRLDWLVKQHLSESNYEPDQVSPFFGGYILSVGAEIWFNPQCCGDLSDVMWWKHVCYDMTNVYYNGHPCPELKFNDNLIVFHCRDDDDPFDFQTKTSFSVEQRDLISAYESMLPVLMGFRDRIVHAIGRIGLPIDSESDLSALLTTRNIELDEHDPTG